MLCRIVTSPRSSILKISRTRMSFLTVLQTILTVQCRPSVLLKHVPPAHMILGESGVRELYLIRLSPLFVALQAISTLTLLRAPVSPWHRAVILSVQVMVRLTPVMEAHMMVLLRLTTHFMYRCNVIPTMKSALGVLAFSPMTIFCRISILTHLRT